MHPCIHACMHAYMHTCIHAYMHTCIHAYMHTCIHAYMHTCIHAYMHTYIHTCMHPYIHAYMHTCIHAYMHTYMHTYIHTCMHAYIHACIHTYIHTYTYIWINSVTSLWPYWNHGEWGPKGNHPKITLFRVVKYQNVFHTDGQATVVESFLPTWCSFWEKWHLACGDCRQISWSKKLPFTSQTSQNRRKRTAVYMYISFGSPPTGRQVQSD